MWALGTPVDAKALRVRTGEHVLALAASVASVGTDLSGVGRLGEPAAGQSIAVSLTSVVSAWVGVVPSMATELSLLGGAVNSAATMLEKVEVQVGERFRMFAI